jgi:hypothetical protein
MSRRPTTRDRIVALLSDGAPRGYREVSDAVGVSVDAVRVCIYALRKANPKALVIRGYEPALCTGGRPSPLFSPGPGRDVRPPVGGAEANREKAKRYYRKNAAVIRAKREAVRSGSVNPYLQLLQRSS